MNSAENRTPEEVINKNSMSKNQMQSSMGQNTIFQKFRFTHSNSQFQAEYKKMAKHMRIKNGLKERSIIKKDTKYFYGSTGTNFTKFGHSSSFRIKTQSSFANKFTPKKFFTDKKDMNHTVQINQDNKFSFIPIENSNQKVKRRSQSLNIQLTLQKEKQKQIKIMSKQNFKIIGPSSDKKSASHEKNNIFSIKKKKPKKYVKVFNQSRYSEFNEDFGLLLTGNIKKRDTKQNPIKFEKEAKKDLEKIFNHFQSIILIHDEITPSPYIKPKQIVSAIKNYTLEKGKNSFDEILHNPEDKAQFKQLLALERALFICILDLIMKQKIENLANQCRIYLEHIIGFFGMIFMEFKDTKYQKKCQQGLKKMAQKQIQIQKSLSKTVIYLFGKIHLLYRFSPEFYHSQIKPIIHNSLNLTLNRSFYDLLTVFASYLCEMELNYQFGNFKYLQSFMTCPSPFIIENRKQKFKWSLVLDLDETLLHASFNNEKIENKLKKTAMKDVGDIDKEKMNRENQFSELMHEDYSKQEVRVKDYGTYHILYRPHCLEFLKKMSQDFEIIIFTSSISSYAEEVLSPFSKYIDHILCRQHTIKSKGTTIKDLSRIGRPIETMIIVDNIPQNFLLQKENGIPIKSWYGETDDRQLIDFEQLLLKIVQKDQLDLRKAFQQVLEEERKNLNPLKDTERSLEEIGIFQRMMKFFA